MRIPLIIMFCISLIFAGTNCFEGYSDAAKKIEAKQIKIQAGYATKSIRYTYQFFPVTMFPFFCSKEDTLQKAVEKNSMPIYLCGNSVAIRKYLDKSSTMHLMISTLSYIKCIELKTYTLYFLKYNSITKEWDEERNPLIVTFYVKDREKDIWGCR